jgi:hypothetical protein
MIVYRSISAVTKALAKSGIEKTRVDEHRRYQFRGIDDIYNNLAPLLAENGLVIMPRVVSRECVERTSRHNIALFYTVLQCEFDFIAVEDGSKHTVVTYGEAMDSGDKSTNKAMSAAYKYAVIQTFAIPTTGDNDADATTHDVVPDKAMSRSQSHDGRSRPWWPEGPSRNKTEAQAMMRDFQARANSSNSLDEFETLLDEAQPLIAQFRMAEHPWWVGGSEIPRTIGDWIEEMRAGYANSTGMKESGNELQS